MQTDKFGRVFVDANEVFDALYFGKNIDIGNLFLNDSDIRNQFNNAVQTNGDDILPLTVPEQLDISVTEFDQQNQNNWFIPQEYHEFDLVNWLYERCDSELSRDRVTQELELYTQYNLYDLLLYLKYLVDTMRSNNIVWGVGRGSSVSSYVLFLIGVHKIDSLRYNLDIHEFLKPKEK